MSLTSEERDRYSRHLVLAEVGIAGQERLKAARVLVVGAGGLGSPAALYLAASGVGTLGIIDCDRVDASNLQRQVLFTTSNIGRSKTDAAREQLLALNPEITVRAHDVELRASNAKEVIREYDVVVDGTDRIATRYLVNDVCVLLGKPLVTAAIHRFEGQAMTVVPKRGPCYRCLFPQGAEESAVANCAEAGVLGVLPGVLGTIQATEAIKLILGIGEPLIGRLLSYDALELSFREFHVSRRTDCAVCGDQPTILAPRDIPQLCDTTTLESVRRLSPRELQSRLTSGEPLVLIDVREPHEFSKGHLRNAVNIPLAQLEQQLPLTSQQQEAVFVCRSGNRSLRACALAQRAGINSPAHLEGGLLAWSAEVDPSLIVAQA